MSDFHTSLDRALITDVDPSKLVLGSIDFTKVEVGPIVSVHWVVIPLTPLAEQEIPAEGVE